MSKEIYTILSIPMILHIFSLMFLSEEQISEKNPTEALTLVGFL
ncbi:hypothetical protein [Desulfosporosinus acidiphilus]|nr:hypothetical protein [Desulfosporosinus acidiphilus]